MTNATKSPSEVQAEALKRSYVDTLVKNNQNTQEVRLPAQQKVQPLNQNNLPHTAPTATQIPAPAPGAKLSAEHPSIPREFLGNGVASAAEC